MDPVSPPPIYGTFLSCLDSPTGIHQALLSHIYLQAKFSKDKPFQGLNLVKIEQLNLSNKILTPKFLKQNLRC